MTDLLDGRHIAVTGGANGLGAAVARRFAELGARGAVLDLPDALVGSAPEGWHQAPVDVTDEAGVEAALAQAAATLGALDGVVAAAGIVPPWQAIEDLDLAEFDRVLAVNARGVAATIKHAARVLPSGSTITVIASLNAWRGDPNIASYAASKHAVLGLVRSAALALGPQGIRVNAVGPGPIATDALKARMVSREERTGLDLDAALSAAAAATALHRIATAAEVANTIAFLTSAMSSGITGQLINVDGGLL